MIDPSMDSLVNYLMKMRGEGEPNPMMPPQQPQPQINPAVAGIMQMLQGQQGQQQNPMMAEGGGAADTIVNRFKQVLGNRFKQVQDNIKEPVVLASEQQQQTAAPTPVSQPTVTPEAQNVNPSNVIRIGGVTKRWDDYSQGWKDMSPEEVQRYEAAGGKIRE